MYQTIFLGLVVQVSGDRVIDMQPFRSVVEIIEDCI